MLSILVTIKPCCLKCFLLLTTLMKQRVCFAILIRPAVQDICIHISLMMDWLNILIRLSYFVFPPLFLFCWGRDSIGENSLLIYSKTFCFCIDISQIKIPFGSYLIWDFKNFLTRIFWFPYLFSWILKSLYCMKTYDLCETHYSFAFLEREH